MGLTIAEQVENLLHGTIEARLRDLPLFTVAQADIALTAVMAVLLAEIAQQLTAPAYPVVGGVADHGMNTLCELRLTILIDGGHQLDVLLVFTSLGIPDVWRFLLWDEVKDVPLAETFKDHVDLMGLEAALRGEETLVDIVVVGEESAVVAQQGCDDFLLVG